MIRNIDKFINASTNLFEVFEFVHRWTKEKVGRAAKTTGQHLQLSVLVQVIL